MLKLIGIWVLGLALVGITDVKAFAQESSQWLSNMTDEQRAVFRNEVRNYLLENPEVIREAIGVLEKRRKQNATRTDAAAITKNAGAIYNDGYSYTEGNPDGDITIVEFSDYRCAFCKRSHPIIREMMERDPNLRLVLKEFPILGPDSVAASRLALAALEIDPEKFSELNDALMSFRGELTEPMSYRIAGQVGYDIAEIKSIAQTDRINRRIAQNYALADELGLNGTPSFIIGRQIIRGYLPLDQMQAVVGEARRRLN